MKSLARVLFFWPTVLFVRLGIVLVELGDTRVGSITISPAFRLVCRWVLYARALPVLREKSQQVLPAEELSALLAGQRLIAVIPCACRAGASPCKHPAHRPHESETCLSLGLVALLQIGSGVGRRLNPQEALALCERAADSGLVQHGLYSFGRLTEICNCCVESCGVLRAFHRGIREAVRPSAFIAVRGAECDGCKDRQVRRCEEICPYDFGPSNPDCLGCGLCVRHCPNQAIRLIPRTMPGALQQHFRVV